MNREEAGVTLRLAPVPRPEGGFEVGQTLSVGGEVRAHARVAVSTLLARDELADLQWYHEDFPQFMVPSAARVAGLVARRTALAGTALHQSLFVHDADGARIWSLVAPALDRTRVEVEVDVAAVDAYPWELIRADADALPLAVAAGSFVRVYAGLETRRPQPDADGDRVLIVICRPDAERDVPFRSVAGRLLMNGTAALVAPYVLRPPTFDSLARVLKDAQDRGQPFRVVHFDGHGESADLFGSGEERGYLVFEDASTAGNRALVHGTRLGRLLARHGVRILVLNACRSGRVGVDTASNGPSSPGAFGTKDPGAAVSAYGSLAGEITRAGVTGVVAMRYNVWVDTAAAFTDGVYSALFAGASLGEAVRSARQELFCRTARSVPHDAAHAPLDAVHGSAGHRVQDWQVPVVYEQAPVHLRPAHPGPRPAPPAMLGFPPPPPYGYVGHDAAVLGIDRAFDEHRLVLLRGPAGSGKTGVVGEYARWARATGAVTGATVYQSLAAYGSVGELLDGIGRLVIGAPEWEACEPDERRGALLEALRHSPALLVLDDADRVSGGLPGRAAVWPAVGSAELRAFVSELAGTGCRVLVAGRRTEDWLRGLGGIGLPVPGLPRSERNALVRLLARAAGRVVPDPSDWDPLLELAAGNGLALVALTELGLAAGIDSRRAARALVDRIRDGDALWADGSAREGVRALEGELAQALECFARGQRARLALLTFFTGVFTETTVRYLGERGRPWAVKEIEGITALDLVSLLYEFAESGWLEPLPGGYFVAHPLLPLLLRPHFTRLYGRRTERVVRAVVEVMAAMGAFVIRARGEGETMWTEAMKYELADLRYALHLAVTRDRWQSVVPILQAIQLPLRERPHDPDAADLVEAVSPMFLTDEGGPVRGRESSWVLVLAFNITLARARNAYDEAERLTVVGRDRLRELRDGATDPDELSYWTRNLADALYELGSIRRSVAEPSFLDAWHEAYELYADQGMRTRAGACARDLAAAYAGRTEHRDDEQAEVWTRRAVALIPDDRNAMALMSSLRALIKAERAHGTGPRRDPGRRGNPGAPEDPGPRGAPRPRPELTREERAGLAHDTRQGLGGDFLHFVTDEYPLPPRTDPRGRLYALHIRAGLRLLQEDERGFVDYLEALHIAHDLNDLISQADTELELARESYAAHRHDHATAYAQAALTHFTEAGRRGTAGVVKARTLLHQIERTPE